MKRSTRPLHELAARGDAPSLLAKLGEGTAVDGRDDCGWTPLMVAAASNTAGEQVLQVLIDHGADVNALTLPIEIARPDESVLASMRERGFDTSIFDAPKGPKDGDSVLACAIKTINQIKLRKLLAAGADATFVNSDGYSLLTSAMFRSEKVDQKQLCEIVTTLIDAGAPLNVESSYGESALRVASHRGLFAVVALLVARGADPTPLGWTPLHHAIAGGTYDQVVANLDAGVDSEARDCWSRTPFLLAVQAGRADVAELLLQRGCDRSALGRCGKTALMHAITHDDATMCEWLIERGHDVEQCNKFGNSPLVEAIQYDAVACVKLLLAAGAKTRHRDHDNASPISDASSAAIIELLAAAGEDLNEVGSESRQLLLQMLPDVVSPTDEEYRRYRHREFGVRNPTRMNNPLWDSLIRSRESAYACAKGFGDSAPASKPTWCFRRFGQSLTRLPDGRYVEIAGEHEDHYDPDFCIYNDVVVHDRGTFVLYGYPENVFPTTDFHSATVAWPWIYIIGNLGYPQQRSPGETPVFRLNCNTWAIERVNCRGAAPGWIHRHKASLVGDHQIIIREGLIDDGSGGELIENADEFMLDLESFTWSNSR